MGTKTSDVLLQMCTSHIKKFSDKDYNSYYDIVGYDIV